MIVAIALALAAALSATSVPAQHHAQNIGTRVSTRSLANGTAAAIKGPQQLALDAAGNLYVANSGTNQVLIYNPSLMQLTTRTISNSAQAEGVAVDPYGNVFVGNTGSNQVTEFTPSGQTLRVFGGLLQPTNLAVDALDDVYVVNANARALSIFQKNGQPVRTVPFSNLTSIALDSATLVLSVATSPAFQLWDADSFVSGLEAFGGSAALSANAIPTGTAADASGGLWFTDASNRRIIHVTLSGNALTLTSETIFKQLSYVPTGIVVDSARNRIYVSDFSDNQIHVINMQTAALVGIIH